MGKIKYVSKKFRPATLDLIIRADAIIQEYQADGYTLTVRQLYYQFVARDLLANTQQNYNKVKSILSNGRLAGLIDWEAIEDRTRKSVRNSHWTSPRGIIESAAYGYAIDHWVGQNYRVEVWCEKEALSGVFERVCKELDVPFLACRGYVSQSEMWRAASRLKKWERRGFETIVFHFGDHDPSGLDMTRDIRDRLGMFGAETRVQRMALNMDQVEQYNPPPNFAKQTDARYADYEREFGDKSWEIDALEPRTLVELVEEAVFDVRDPDAYGVRVEKEAKEKEQLKKAAKRWTSVASFLDSEPNDEYEEDEDDFDDDDDDDDDGEGEEKEPEEE